MNTLLLFAASWWESPEPTWPRVADHAISAVVCIAFFCFMYFCWRDKSED